MDKVLPEQKRRRRPRLAVEETSTRAEMSKVCE